MKEELVRELKEASDKYYNNGTSPLTDEEFDFKRNKLKEIDPDNYFLKTIGASPAGKTIRHEFSMMSLDDYWDYDNLPKVIKEADKAGKLIPELKYDGIAISIVYLNGELLYAATRGDGFIGEVITSSVRHVEGVPGVLSKPLKGTLEVRGEILMPRKAFKVISQELGYANPRNTVAGLLRRNDSTFVKDKGLVFIPYDITRHPFEEVENYSELREKVLEFSVGTQGCKEVNKSLNWFKGIQTQYRNSEITFNELVEAVIKEREGLAFDIDGIVFKYDNFAERKELGFTGRTPRWGVAYKFPGSTGITTLEAVEWQVSRYGKLTPVGKVAPVNIGGVVYTSVTLHNMEEIGRLDLHLNDKIMIERRGDVIPKVMKVVLKPNNREFISVPFNCPSCNSLVRQLSLDPTCTNENCLEQLSLRIVHYASRKAMDIEGLAESTARQLVSSGLVKNIGDLYSLTLEGLLGLEGFAKLSSENLLKGIEKSKERPIDNLIFGLGIKGFGESTSKALASLVGDLKGLYDLRGNPDSLMSMLRTVPQSVIDITARTELLKFIENKDSINILHKLLEKGINPSYSSNVVSDKLKDKTFVITGSFEGIRRDDISKMVQENGGTISSGVSKNTSYLIAGEKAGSKLLVANKLKVKVITLEEFKSMID